MCTYLDALCIQLHKYVFCFLGATNKAFTRIQSTYLNNCSVTRACTLTHIAHCDIATLGNMSTNPSPCLSSHAPLQGADVWGQLTASANFCVQSKQQHSALLAAKGNLLLKKKRGWGRPLSQCRYHEDEWRGKRVRRDAHRGESMSRLHVGFIGNSPRLFLQTWCWMWLKCRTAWCSVQTAAPCGITHEENQPRWLCEIV